MFSEVRRMEKKGLIFTNDNCISCNKCVRVCTSPGASFVHTDGISTVVQINEERCISCGACFALCEHNARDYHDDTIDFFEDLKRGEDITLLLAPAFKASYPREYGTILGGLKKLGVKRIISVAFGADICTWAYLKCITEKGLVGKISSPCPVTVSYIEHCMPELIDSLMPVYSPLLCAAIYCREVLGIKDKLAFLGPCIGKKYETDDYMDSPVHYNVTFLKFMEYVRSQNITGPDVTDEIEHGLGSFYPAPGGLADNIRWFMGDDVPVRVVSGKTFLYGWLKKNKIGISSGNTPFMLIDALNCQEGCIEGTASESQRFLEDAAFYAINKIRRNSKKTEGNSPWNPELTPKERLHNLNEQFKDLDLSHYLRSFTDMSNQCKSLIPTDEEADRIFNSMHKTTAASRHIDCSACGYYSCHDMMVAIYNGFNIKKSCLHYQMDEALRLERLSMNDPLTGIMNRSGLKNVLTHQYGNKSLAVIAADINGLKEVNDNQGHEAGDRLIVTIATCLSEVFGNSHVFRTGGDEFIAIQYDHSEEECIKSIEQLRKIMSNKKVSASLGYAFTPCYNSDFSRLQDIADKHMYEDKEYFYRLTGKIRRT